jgi:hypothetical protein
MQTKKLLAGALASAAAVATGVAVLGAPASATIPNCSSTGLQVHYEFANGTAGTVYDVWQLTNISSATCHLQGYVTFRNFAPDGRPYGSSIVQQGTPSLVTLAHGQHASFAFGVQDPSITGCTPENAVNMILFIPNVGVTAPILAGRGEKACGGQVKATPLQFGG